MGRSLKDLRVLKRTYTREYSGKNLIINFRNYPSVDFIITHGDGKSWGAFRDSDNLVSLGRGNSKAADIILKSTKFSYVDVKNIVVLSDNPEVERVYSKVLKSFSSHGEEYYWRDVLIARDFLKLNPVLYAKVVDGLGERVKDSECYSRNLDSIRPEDIIHICVDYTAPTIRTAFGTSFKFASLMLTLGFTKEQFETLINANYNVQEIEQYKKAFVGWNTLMSNFWGNKQVVKYFCNLEENLIYNYRDYLRMLSNLPETMRKDFPLTPRVDKIRDWHDRAMDLYYRHQAEIRELKNKELNDKYIKEFLPKAEKFEFSDDTYSIIACKKLSQLSFEGQTLHHCVGSYMNSVGNGKEYILFMRKNEELDKPFYTIDLTPEKKVRQIHGFGNSNITEGMKPFLSKWAKKFKLNINNCSGVYCSL